MNDLILERAALYIEHGFSVHPVTEKAPNIKKWSRAHLTFEEFKNHYVEGNGIGVLTGKRNNLVCIDIDPKNGGNAWYEANKINLGNPIVEHSGSGGLHLYYRYPESVNYIHSKTKYALGVDILADGGRQVVTAPSPHASGRPYYFDNDLNLTDVAFEADDFPTWLLIDLSTRSGKSAEPRLADDDVSDLIPALEQAREAVARFRPAVQGQAGDATTYEAACLVRDFGLTKRQAFEVLWSDYNPKCQPPWDANGLKRKIQNAYTYANGPMGGKLAQNEFSNLNGKTPSVAQSIQADSKGLIVTSFKNFCEQYFPPKEFILGPFMRQGLSLIFAAPGVGKTYFSLGLAHAIASGNDFLTWKARKPYPVLYIDGEMQAAVLQERLRGLSGDSYQDLNFNIITPDTQIRNVMPDLSSPEGQKLLEPLLEVPELIIIDNLSCLSRTGDENEAASWIPLQTWALGLRQRGKSVIFVHHAGKGSDQRGTSKKEDVLDLVIRLAHPAEYTAQDGCMFELSFKKARHYESLHDIRPFQAQFNEGQWTTSDLEELIKDKILEFNSLGSTPTQTAEALGLTKIYVNKVLNASGIETVKSKTRKSGKEFQSFSEPPERDEAIPF